MTAQTPLTDVRPSAMKAQQIAMSWPEPGLAPAVSASVAGPHANPHIDLAMRMAAAGKVAEARWYMRHLARGCLRYARAMRKKRSDLHAIKKQIAREVAEGLGYVAALRAFPIAGRVAGTEVVLPYRRHVHNPHWPKLDAHGVYAKVHENKPTPSTFILEVQIHAPDADRTSCCVRGTFPIERAAKLARQWVTVGEAIMEATR